MQVRGSGVRHSSGALNLAAGVAVSLKRATKTFFGSGGARIEALTDLSLELPERKMTALLGQNGAGKSTAIGVLTGLFPPSSGSVSILGRSVRRCVWPREGLPCTPCQLESQHAVLVRRLRLGRRSLLPEQ